MTKRDNFDTLNTDKREGKTNMTKLADLNIPELADLNLPTLGNANVPELADLNLPESDNPFIHIDEEGNFIEPIKNPFSCEGAYLLACEDVANALKADLEVGYKDPAYIQMLNWLDKLAYEYI